MATAYSRSRAPAAAPYSLFDARPILPRIASVSTYGDPPREGRLEKLLQHLRRVALATRGREAAQFLHLYVAGLDEHKGNLRVSWRLYEAMEALRPAVKHAWGVLDVGTWYSATEVEHSCGDAWIRDTYSPAEISAFADLMRSCGDDEDKALRSGLPEPYRAWLDGEDALATAAKAVWGA